MQPDFEKFSDKLVPVVVQDFATKEVIMMAYANEEAYNKTVETNMATYWSRSRNEIWVKGLTSGNTQIIKEIRIDCDRDCVIYIVDQNGGAACHKGYRSCFYRKLDQGEFVIDGELVFDPKEVYKK